MSPGRGAGTARRRRHRAGAGDPSPPPRYLGAARARSAATDRRPAAQARSPARDPGSRCGTSADCRRPRVASASEPWAYAAPAVADRGRDNGSGSRCAHAADPRPRWRGARTSIRWSGPDPRSRRPRPAWRCRPRGGAPIRRRWPAAPRRPCGTTSHPRRCPRPGVRRSSGRSRPSPGPGPAARSCRHPGIPAPHPAVLPRRTSRDRVAEHRCDRPQRPVADRRAATRQRTASSSAPSASRRASLNARMAASASKGRRRASLNPSSLDPSTMSSIDRTARAPLSPSSQSTWDAHSSKPAPTILTVAKA